MLTGSSSPGEGGAGEEPRSQDFVLVTWWSACCQLSTNHLNTRSFPYTFCPLHLFLPIAKHHLTLKCKWLSSPWPFSVQKFATHHIISSFNANHYHHDHHFNGSEPSSSSNGRVCPPSNYFLFKCKPLSSSSPSSSRQWTFFLLKWKSLPPIPLFPCSSSPPRPRASNNSPTWGSFESIIIWQK